MGPRSEVIHFLAEFKLRWGERGRRMGNEEEAGARGRGKKGEKDAAHRQNEPEDRAGTPERHVWWEATGQLLGVSW